MPLLFFTPVCVIAVGYLIWKKAKINTSANRYISLSVCTITWMGMVYQFISISRYIDSSGEKISNVIGKYGNILSWVTLIAFSVYLVVIYIDTFRKKK